MECTTDHSMQNLGSVQKKCEYLIQTVKVVVSLRGIFLYFGKLYGELFLIIFYFHLLNSIIL